MQLFLSSIIVKVKTSETNEKIGYSNWCNLSRCTRSPKISTLWSHNSNKNFKKKFFSLLLHPTELWPCPGASITWPVPWTYKCCPSVKLSTIHYIVDLPMFTSKQRWKKKKIGKTSRVRGADRRKIGRLHRAHVTIMPDRKLPLPHNRPSQRM